MSAAKQDDSMVRKFSETLARVERKHPELVRKYVEYLEALAKAVTSEGAAQ